MKIKKQSILVKTLILHTGYAEDQSNSGMFLTNTPGFGNYGDLSAVNVALQNLANILKKHMLPPETNEQCSCLIPPEHVELAKYCIKCGDQLWKIEENREAELQDQIFQLIGGTCQELDNDLFVELDHNGWLFDYKHVDMKKAYVVSRADEVLANIACNHLRNDQFNNVMVCKVGE